MFWFVFALTIVHCLGLFVNEYKSTAQRIAMVAQVGIIVWGSILIALNW